MLHSGNTGNASLMQQALIFTAHDKTTLLHREPRTHFLIINAKKVSVLSKVCLHTVFTQSDLKGEFSQHRDLFVNTLQRTGNIFFHLIHVSLISNPFVYLHFAIV